MINVILQSLGLDLVKINGYAKVYQNILNGLRVVGIFREPSGDKQLNKLPDDRQVWIWTSTKPRPMTNGIWQSLRLHLVNINVHAKFHHNIPLGSRDRALFTFQNLELDKASTADKYHFVISLARSCQYQCVCKSLSTYFKRFFKELWTFFPGLRELSGDGQV